MRRKILDLFNVLNECKVFGHRASECSNRKVKKHGKVDSVENPLPDTVSAMAFMARSSHGSSDFIFYYDNKESGDELDWKEKYKIMLKKSMKMTRLF